MTGTIARAIEMEI